MGGAKTKEGSYKKEGKEARARNELQDRCASGKRGRKTRERGFRILRDHGVGGGKCTATSTNWNELFNGWGGGLGNFLDRGGGGKSTKWGNT